MRASSHPIVDILYIRMSIKEKRIYTTRAGRILYSIKNIYSVWQKVKRRQARDTELTRRASSEGCTEYARNMYYVGEAASVCV